MPLGQQRTTQVSVPPENSLAPIKAFQIMGQRSTVKLPRLCPTPLSFPHYPHLNLSILNLYHCVLLMCYLLSPNCSFYFGRHRWSPKFKIHIIPHRSTKVHAPGHLQLCWPPLPLLASHLPGDPFVSVDRYDAETFVTDWRARRRSPRETHLSRLRSVSEHALGVLEKCATITCIWWSEE